MGKNVEEKGLWESILQEVATAAKVPDGNLLLLGRQGIGKRTMVKALLHHACPAAAATVEAEDNHEEHSRATAMDYAYFGVRDPGLPESEVISSDFICPAACSVLIMEDVKHEKLLVSRVAKFDLKYSAAIICLDMKEPWTMLEDLSRWLDMLQKIIADKILTLSVSEQDELRNRVTDAMAKAKANLAKAASTEGSADSDVGLKYNLGMPLIVVVTRADGASAFEHQKTMNWSAAIEAHLRQACLSYGAAIVYTMVQSGKKNSNINVLYDYLMHRMYDYPCPHQPSQPSQDALFLPSGWDAEARLDTAVLERSFESVVAPPTPASAADVKPEECDDMVTFLKRMQAALQKQGGASAAAQSASRSADQKSKMNMTMAARRGSADPKVVDPAGGGAAPGAGGAPGPAGGPPGTDNSSLANFFQNLLTRGGSATGGAPGSPGAPGVGGLPPAKPAAAPKTNGTKDAVS